MRRVKGFAVDPGWKLMLQQVGVDVADVLRRAGLPADLFARKDAVLSPQECFRFWSETQAQSQNPYVALDAAAQMSTVVFNPVLFAAFCSPNMNAALGRIQRFKPLIGPLRLDIATTSEHTTATLDFSGIALSPPSAFVLGELA
ncbi:MAG: AraC family transcriptional regulator ligand-binding domain-containing protein, partial [Pseudomonadota bacterium]